MLEPFLKWAGGKRWLVQRYADFLPRRFNRYIEPFLGSGAIFFYLLPVRATLADSNAELVDTYRAIKKEPKKIHNRLKLFQELHCPDFYYRIRTTIPDDPIERAVRFIYLNRTCFNGLYRVNRQGIFNVPMGSKMVVEFAEGYLEGVSTALRGAVLCVSDFEATIDQATTGDFLYVDPPYTVMHNKNNFVKYNASLFSWDDQIRLASAIRRAASKGALIMLSNAHHKCVSVLYHEFGNHYPLERSSILASSSERRRKTTELLITNY